MNRPLPFSCPECGQGLPVPKAAISDYFWGVDDTCPSCQHTMDWWKAFLSNIQQEGFQAFTGIFGSAGARWTNFSVFLEPNRMTLYKFADHGIPEGSTILHVNYSPYGGRLGALEFHGNNPAQRVNPSIFRLLYPAQIWDLEELNASDPENVVGPMRALPLQTEVMVSVIWVPHTPDDYAWQSLVEAFRAYDEGRFGAAIVPANVAVESVLGRLLDEFLRGVIPADRAKNFLESAATYSHQLNVVLPAFLSFTRAPQLPGDIRGSLNRLRDFRNAMAHKGEPVVKGVTLDRAEAARLLCAALFGFHYINLARSFLLKDHLAKVDTHE